MKEMNIPALSVLHQYNQYANSLLFESAKLLSEDELTRTSSPSHGSVLGLLQHMLGTEVFFLLECQGLPPAQDTDEVSCLNQLKELYYQVSQQREKYLQNATEEEMQERIRVNIGSGMVELPRWQFLAQSLLASIHHRGELSIVMTGLGYPLPTLDPIIQFVQESGQEWPFQKPKA
ncbi:MAG: DinB family protein [Anaerolineaceae bacterium]